MSVPLRFLRAATLLAAACFVGACGRGQATAPDSPDSLQRTPHAAAFLAWPGATRAVRVEPGGDLVSAGWRAHIEVEADGVPAAPPRAILAEGGWVPILSWRRSSRGARWEFQATGCPDPTGQPAPESGSNRHRDEAAQDRYRALMRRYGESRLDALMAEARPPREDPEPVGLFATLEVRVTNESNAPRVVELAIRLDPPERTVETGSPAGDRLRWGWDSSGPDSAYAWAEGAREGIWFRRAWRLAPRERASERVVLATYPAPARALEAWAKPPHERRIARARAFWNHEMDRGLAVEVGDRDVETALSASRVVLLASRERSGGRWAAVAGPLRDRGASLADAARTIQALAVAGYGREARDLAAGLGAEQWPHGPFAGAGDATEATGEALWAYEQALLRPAPDRSVGRYAADAYRAWRWLERHRAIARSEPPATVGLQAADPIQGSAAPERRDLADRHAWAIAGYRGAARLLTAAGRPNQADSVEASRLTMVAELEHALDARGTAWDESGVDAGDLAIAYPCLALPASHPTLAAIARRVWAARRAGSVPADDAAGGGSCVANLGTWALLSGRRAAADSALQALVGPPSAAGIAASDGEPGAEPVPHASTAAALVTLVRNDLVFDETDTLRLTLGARALWWVDGRVRRAPTRFGLLDLSFHRREGVAEWRWSSVPVWTALTLPPGTRVGGPLASPLEPGQTPDVVLAPPGTRAARVVLRPWPVRHAPATTPVVVTGLVSAVTPLPRHPAQSAEARRAGSRPRPAPEEPIGPSERVAARQPSPPPPIAPEARVTTRPPLAGTGPDTTRAPRRPHAGRPAPTGAAEHGGRGMVVTRVVTDSNHVTRRIRVFVPADSVREP